MTNDFTIRVFYLVTKRNNCCQRITCENHGYKSLHKKLHCKIVEEHEMETLRQNHIVMKHLPSGFSLSDRGLWISYNMFFLKSLTRKDFEYFKKDIKDKPYKQYKVDKNQLMMFFDLEEDYKA